MEHNAAVTGGLLVINLGIMASIGFIYWKNKKYDIDKDGQPSQHVEHKSTVNMPASGKLQENLPITKSTSSSSPPSLSSSSSWPSSHSNTPHKGFSKLVSLSVNQYLLVGVVIACLILSMEQSTRLGWLCLGLCLGALTSRVLTLPYLPVEDAVNNSAFLETSGRHVKQVVDHASTTVEKNIKEGSASSLTGKNHSKRSTQQDQGQTSLPGGEQTTENADMDFPQNEGKNSGDNVPQNPNDVCILADIGEKEQRFQDAKKILYDGIGKWPGHAELLWRMAKIHYLLGKQTKLSSEESQKLFNEGMNYSSQAVSANEKLASAHKWFAILLGEVASTVSKTKQLENAHKFKDHTLRAIELSPHDAQLHYMLGRFSYKIGGYSYWTRSLGKLGDFTYEEALLKFDTAKKLKPNWLMNRVWRAKVLLKLNKNNDAKVEFEHVLSTTPELPEDHQALHIAKTAMQTAGL